MREFLIGDWKEELLRTVLYLCLEIPSVTPRNTQAARSRLHTHDNQCSATRTSNVLYECENMCLRCDCKGCVRQCVPVLSDNNKERVGETASWSEHENGVCMSRLYVWRWPFLVWSSMHEKGSVYLHANLPVSYPSTMSTGNYKQPQDSWTIIKPPPLNHTLAVILQFPAMPHSPQRPICTVKWTSALTVV